MGKKFEEVKGGNPVWKPTKEGDMLEGEVTAVVPDGQYGLQLSVKKEDDTEVRTPSHKALQSRLKDIKVGDYIKVTLTGTELPKVKGHSPTMLYKVEKAVN